ASQLIVVSAERISQELSRMLTNEHRARGMRLIEEVGLLGVIFPELERQPRDAWERTMHMLQHLQNPTLELAMAVLWHSIPQDDNATEVAHELGKRFRMSNHEVEQIAWLMSHHRALNEAPEMPLCRLKRLLAHPQIEDLLKLMRVERLTTDADLKPVLFCEDYLRKTPMDEINPPPLISGADLIAQGLKPGPQFKELLDTVRDAQLNGEIQTHEEALAMIQKRL
ncbi:MAG: hypothetical protein KDA84_17690, partial [Planctomycetaceae bacterium]|nr:hypothetical protein [Planctomycetaceae bacterium]